MQFQYQAEQECIEEYHRIKQLRNRQHRCPSEHGRDGAEAITQQPGSQQKDGDIREEQSDHPTQQGQNALRMPISGRRLRIRDKVMPERLIAGTNSRITIISKYCTIVLVLSGPIALTPLISNSSCVSG